MKVFLMREIFQELTRNSKIILTLEMKQIIKRFVIFNNQTEIIDVQVHKFVAWNQSYLRKLE